MGNLPVSETYIANIIRSSRLVRFKILYDNSFSVSLMKLVSRTIYFCGMFDTPLLSHRVFSGTGTALSQYGNGNTASGTERVGAVFSFAQKSVTSRVGISWISSAKACQYANNEIPSGTPLQSLVSASKQAWNSQVLAKIQTTEV